MTDLEKELVEKLAIEEQRPFYGATQDIADMPIEVARKRVEVMFMPLIRSHTQALVAAAYARATNLIAQVRDDYHSNDGPFDMGMRLQMLENEVCSLTPADAARELEQREWEARKREHSEQEWARLWPPEKDLTACAWGPKCVRCAELNRQIEALRASLSKPAPVSQTITPGICAKHAIVTPTCRNNRTPLGALAEAVERLQLEYIELLNHEGTDAVTYHFVLTVERKPAPVEKEQRE